MMDSFIFLALVLMPVELMVKLGLTDRIAIAMS